jgi:hypothetical protein
MWCGRSLAFSSVLGPLGTSSTDLGNEARPGVDVRSRDDERAAALKHDAHMAGVIRRAVEAWMAPAAHPVVLRIGATPVRL